MTTHKNPAVFYITASVATLSLSFFFLAVFKGWFGPATDVGGAFCEAARPGMVKQPANTWSNLAFVVAGLAMAWQMSSGAFAQNKNKFTQSNFTAIFFSVLVVLLGPGSMAMHATETQLGGSLDMLSMYLVAAFAASYAMQRFFNWQNWQFFVSFLLIIIFCEWAGTFHMRIPLVHYAGNAAFGLFLIVSAIFELLNGYVRHLSMDKKYGYYSLASITLAFIIWNMWLDGSPLCNPGSLIQGHAMWHMLDALAAYFLFRMYVSEHAE